MPQAVRGTQTLPTQLPPQQGWPEVALQAWPLGMQSALGVTAGPQKPPPSAAGWHTFGAWQSWAVAQGPKGGLNVQPPPPPSPTPLSGVVVFTEQVLLVGSQMKGAQHWLELVQVEAAGRQHDPPLQVSGEQHAVGDWQAAVAPPQVAPPLLELLLPVPPLPPLLLAPVEPPLLELLLLLAHADSRPPLASTAANIPRTLFELTVIGVTPLE
jgi:hypothetical protein